MKIDCLRTLPIVLIVGIVSMFIGCGRTKKNEPAPLKENVLPAEIKTPDNRPIIAAFGDSLTSGQGVDPGRNYPSQLQERIDAEGYRYKVVNAGVSGETSAQGVNRIQSVIGLQPSIVIVELGANDGLRGLPAAATQRNLELIIQHLQAAGAKIVLAGMQVPPNYGPQYTKAFRDIFKNVAKQHDIPLIPFFLEGVGGIAALNQDDGVHPTAEGYSIVVENVWKQLKPLL
jgi:acyl-CoA thioesterase-1